MRAASQGHAGVVEWLLSQGVEVDAQDKRVGLLEHDVIPSHDGPYV